MRCSSDTGGEKIVLDVFGVLGVLVKNIWCTGAQNCQPTRGAGPGDWTEATGWAEATDRADGRVIYVGPEYKWGCRGGRAKPGGVGST